MQCAWYESVIGNSTNLSRQIDLPKDELSFDDFTLDFMVDENLENFMEIQKWMRGLGYPESIQEAKDLDSGKTKFEDKDQKSLIIRCPMELLSILNSSQNQISSKFKGLFPVSLTGLDFDGARRHCVLHIYRNIQVFAL